MRNVYTLIAILLSFVLAPNVWAVEPGDTVEDTAIHYHGEFILEDIRESLTDHGCDNSELVVGDDSLSQCGKDCGFSWQTCDLAVREGGSGQGH